MKINIDNNNNNIINKYSKELYVNNTTTNNVTNNYTNNKNNKDYLLNSDKQILSNNTIIDPSKQSYSEIILNYFLKSLKILSFKILLSLITNRKLILKSNFEFLIKLIFNINNLKFAFSLASIALIYRLLYKSILLVINNIKMLKELNTNSIKNFIKFVCLFISSYTSISSFSQSNTLVFLVLIFATKVVINYIENIFKFYNLFQDGSRLYDYLFFAFSATLWTLAMFLNPENKQIPKIVERYGNYTDSEKKEFGYLMQNTRII